MNLLGIIRREKNETNLLKRQSKKLHQMLISLLSPLTGPSRSAGPRGAEGPAGIPGGGGTARAKGGHGRSGAAGAKVEKKSNEILEYQACGKCIFRGPKGDRGKMGMPGFPGINGIHGLQGAPGPQGIPGLDGCNGTDVRESCFFLFLKKNLIYKEK